MEPQSPKFTLSRIPEEYRDQEITSELRLKIQQALIQGRAELGEMKRAELTDELLKQLEEKVNCNSSLNLALTSIYPFLPKQTEAPVES